LAIVARPSGREHTRKRRVSPRVSRAPRARRPPGAGSPPKAPRRGFGARIAVYARCSGARMSARIVVVSGSSRLESHVHDVVDRVAMAARSAGAELREVHLHHLRLPMMDHGNAEQAELPAVREVREVAAWADGF